MSAVLSRGVQRYGYVGPAMVGLVRKTKPVITVMRYDPVRRALIDSMPRDKVIEAIARQLYECADGNNLRQMYASEPSFTRRTEAEIVLDARAMLNEQWEKQRAKWGFA